MEGACKDRTSQTQMHGFFASQGNECLVVVKVLPSTVVLPEGSGNKVKVSGIIVSEEVGMRSKIEMNLAALNDRTRKSQKERTSAS